MKLVSTRRGRVKQTSSGSLRLPTRIDAVFTVRFMGEQYAAEIGTAGGAELVG